MKVGWLADNPAHSGGAELTASEFRHAAPKGVEVIERPPGADLSDLDACVVHNCMSYSLKDVFSLGQEPRRIIRYHHDVARAPIDPYLAQLRDVTHVFCSPLQRERMGMKGELIPPALDLERFRAYADSNHRNGAVCIGRMAYGKGLALLSEFPEPVDVYSTLPVPSEGSVRFQGASEDPAKTLARYRTFVFLPTAIEPFGRAVVEAWAAGLEVVVNRNVGALYWIRENPEALDTAADDFWQLVL